MNLVRRPAPFSFKSLPATLALSSNLMPATSVTATAGRLKLGATSAAASRLFRVFLRFTDVSRFISMPARIPPVMLALLKYTIGSCAKTHACQKNQHGHTFLETVPAARDC